MKEDFIPEQSGVFEINQNGDLADVEQLFDLRTEKYIKFRKFMESLGHDEILSEYIHPEYLKKRAENKKFLAKIHRHLTSFYSRVIQEPEYDYDFSFYRAELIKTFERSLDEIAHNFAELEKRNVNLIEFIEALLLKFHQLVELCEVNNEFQIKKELTQLANVFIIRNDLDLIAVDVREELNQKSPGILENIRDWIGGIWKD